jgi:hypothetical protein
MVGGRYLTTQFGRGKWLFEVFVGGRSFVFVSEVGFGCR